MKLMPDPISNVMAYAWVFSGTFSLQEDIRFSVTAYSR